MQWEHIPHSAQHVKVGWHEHCRKLSVLIPLYSHDTSFSEHLPQRLQTLVGCTLSISSSCVNEDLNLKRCSTHTELFAVDEKRHHWVKPVSLNNNYVLSNRDTDGDGTTYNNSSADVERTALGVL